MIVKANSNLLNSPTTAVETVKTLHLINGEHFSGAERVQDLLALARFQNLVTKLGSLVLSRISFRKFAIQIQRFTR